jgi:hypothetical protein
MPTVANKEKGKNCHCTLHDMEGKGFLSQNVKECSKLAIIFKLNPTIQQPQRRRNSWSFEEKLQGHNRGNDKAL